MNKKNTNDNKSFSCEPYLSDTYLNDSFIKDLNTNIINVANQTCDSILKSGISVITAGNNGPYYNIETDVRNLAHWCVTFSRLYFIENNSDKKHSYYKCVLLLADAILSSNAYNGQGVYKCREKAKSDEVNGTIGPAWIIEGLIWAARVFEDTSESFDPIGNPYYLRALKIFKVVPFNYSLGIWNRLNTANETLSVDTTFNHQLWFAAAGAMINNFVPDEQIEQQLRRFTNRLPINITVRKNGRIGHFTLNDQNGVLGYPGKFYRDVKSDLAELMNKPSFKYKETGYHAFNLYGFAILAENVSWTVPFFKSKKFKKSIDYLFTTEYINALQKSNISLDCTHVTTKLNVEFNIFGYAYNSPAFELPRILKTFAADIDETEKISLLSKLSQKQLEFTYDKQINRFECNTDDAVTLNTRIYEYI